MADVRGALPLVLTLNLGSHFCLGWHFACVGGGMGRASGETWYENGCCGHERRLEAHQIKDSEEGLDYMTGLRTKIINYREMTEYTIYRSSDFLFAVFYSLGNTRSWFTCSVGPADCFLGQMYPNHLAVPHWSHWGGKKENGHEGQWGLLTWRRIPALFRDLNFELWCLLIAIRRFAWLQFCTYSILSTVSPQNNHTRRVKGHVNPTIL